MTISYSDYGDRWRYIEVMGASIYDPKHGIVYARQMYPEYIQKTRNRRRSDLLSLLSRGNDLEKAQASYQALIQEFPEGREKWDEERALYLQWYVEKEREILENRIWKEEQEKVAEEYEVAFRAYADQLQMVQDHNQKLLEEIQAAHNEPRTVYQSTYTLVAQDEENAPFLETRSIYVKGEASDGYYETTDGKRVMVFHPVSLAPITIHPTDGIAGTKIVRLDDDHLLYFHADTPSEVIEQATADFLPIPSQPDPDEYGIPYERYKAIRAKVWNVQPDNYPW